MCTKLQDGERKPIAVMIIIIVWQSSLGHLLESQVYYDNKMKHNTVATYLVYQIANLNSSTPL